MVDYANKLNEIVLNNAIVENINSKKYDSLV
jgi:hypothetical protein